jgi:hypothetical protein
MQLDALALPASCTHALHPALQNYPVCSVAPLFPLMDFGVQPDIS